MKNAIQQNGVMIARTPGGVAVSIANLENASLLGAEHPVKVEVDYFGRRIKDELLNPLTPFWRDYFGPEVNHLKLVIRVKDGEQTLAELALPDDEMCLPFMVLQGPQVHVTENYVSVPPALHITDEVGAVWTLGFEVAPKEQSPDGEYAFPVLRDGFKMGEIASRIERRGGGIRIFTRGGYKRWLGREFS